MILHIRCGPAFSKRRIGLLGGSFNPAHEGHLAMSLYALKRLNLHEVWWLVSPQNPLKKADDMLAISLRLSHAKKLARHPRLRVTNLEEQLGTHFTVDILRLLKRRFPLTKFVWLMGADNLRQMPRWHKWPSLWKSVPVAVFRRPAYAVGRKSGKATERFDQVWHPASAAKSLAGKKAPAWVVLDNPLNALSATMIRKDKVTWQRLRLQKRRSRKQKKR